MRRVGNSDPVFVLDEIDKLGPAPAAVLLKVLDPEQNHSFRDAFIELPFDLGAVLFITTANEVARIPPALRDWLEIIGLPGYTEAEKIAIAETYLIPAQNRAAGLRGTPVRFIRGACRRMIRDYTHERGTRQLTRCLQTVCRDHPEGGCAELRGASESGRVRRVTSKTLNAERALQRMLRVDAARRLGRARTASKSPPWRISCTTGRAEPTPAMKRQCNDGND